YEKNKGGAGIYFEMCKNVRAKRLRLGPHMRVGINVEWDHGNLNPYLNINPPRNSYISLSHVISEAYTVGLHIDRGGSNVSINKAAFLKSWMAGILDNNQFTDDYNKWPCPKGFDQSPCINTTNS